MYGREKRRERNEGRVNREIGGGKKKENVEGEREKEKEWIEENEEGRERRM